MADVTGRLERSLGREVQLVRLQEAERTPLLMRDALEHGRVLVDREQVWPRLREQLAMWKRRAAAAERPLEQSDPERARALKAKIRDRVSDVARKLGAEAAWIAADDCVPFYDAYRAWIGRGFSADPAQRRSTQPPRPPEGPAPR